jgi:mono/diheme cytochrome c family protein
VPDPRRPRRVAAGALIALAALAAAGCGSVGYLGEGGNKTNGKALFISACGSCHVLADAGTTGTIGPDLDAGFLQFRRDAEGENPSAEDIADVEATVRQVVRGQIAYPVENPASGAPGMPADIVTGEDADDVATYVASVAGTGKPPAPAPPEPAPEPAPEPSPEPEPPAGGGGDAAAGKEIFLANCGSCHTLADAGTSGTVGPNLDESQPDEALVTELVTNGRGGMPSFKGSLSEEDIANVAAYVSGAAG